MTVLKFQNSDSFSIVITGESISEKICSSVDMPLYMPAIDQALQFISEGIPHVKLYIQWKKDVKDMLVFYNLKFLYEFHFLFVLAK